MEKKLKLFYRVSITSFFCLQCLLFSTVEASKIEFYEYNRESFDYSSGGHMIGSAFMTTKMFELTHKRLGDRNSRIVAISTTLMVGTVWEVLDGLGLTPPEQKGSFKDLLCDGIGVFTGTAITYLDYENRAMSEQIIFTAGIVYTVYDEFMKRTYWQKNTCRFASLPVALCLDISYDILCGDKKEVIFSKKHILLNFVGTTLGLACILWPTKWEYSHR